MIAVYRFYYEYSKLLSATAGESQTATVGNQLKYGKGQTKSVCCL